MLHEFVRRHYYAGIWNRIVGGCELLWCQRGAASHHLGVHHLTSVCLWPVIPTDIHDRIVVVIRAQHPVVAIYIWRAKAKIIMMTPSMEAFFALLAICAGTSPATGEFAAQWPVTRDFDVFFDLRLNNRLSKQSQGWLFETPSCPLWRHCNADPKCYDNKWGPRALLTTISYPIAIQRLPKDKFPWDVCYGEGITSIGALVRVISDPEIQQHDVMT